MEGFSVHQEHPATPVAAIIFTLRCDGIVEALRVPSRGGNGKKRGKMRGDGIEEALRIPSRRGNGKKRRKMRGDGIVGRSESRREGEMGRSEGKCGATGLRRRSESRREGGNRRNGDRVILSITDGPMMHDIRIYLIFVANTDRNENNYCCSRV